MRLLLILHKFGGAFLCWWIKRQGSFFVKMEGLPHTPTLGSTFGGDQDSVLKVTPSELLMADGKWVVKMINYTKKKFIVISH